VRDRSREFIGACWTILRTHGIDRRVALSPAIVVERLARGGGATNWYAIAGSYQLDEFVSLVRPGSRVSFYFDDRLRWMALDDAAITVATEAIASTGDVVIAHRQAGTTLLRAAIVSGPVELAEHARASEREAVLVGRFPAPDNDGVSAFTIDLPDFDGVVRRHPH
jgi:hypothetical protein